MGDLSQRVFKAATNRDGMRTNSDGGGGKTGEEDNIVNKWAPIEVAMEQFIYLEKRGTWERG